jgi:hypothetical protein
MKYWNGHDKQWSAAELSDILREAGFAQVTVSASFGHYSLVRADKR